MIDESHVTLPQVRAMFAGDRARKDNLVRYGFRLPSAYDNRPLNFDEFYDRINQVFFILRLLADKIRRVKHLDDSLYIFYI